MHKSRLACLVIDCEGTDAGTHEAFWAAALGREREADPIDPKYRDLTGPPGELRVLVQAVDHPSRVHLDIETDDIPAEVARLERLGATRLREIKGWVVMEAPSGHRFCVVKPQRPDFAENATVWND
ncbi:VOC family protein [Stappia taiwanensis]|uniref:VOC family protein n=1 Tax=Stappia taiwanensis TaxID=992267 RepID=A0A838XRR4_9HYPH|nr:VOC family protein [Stappia taiwanensis]MBA4613002.1 VOC family protein [Stappia taiwanensis]GGF02002.1 hypothetical protein GCM10007285_32050 [Stappia taiwanensis]